ncbi:MAG: SDR family NAD(P)-dependent oxidoreductase [Candidatus Marinimicrobia bacterium]|jgi:short-subunit dehydrogenase|nr:SDR family NAD(P)-dependent oxidoreductase [Candidatus Neomarinimicrobiota bacterium]MBT3677055.1 SDR family NAD(P)-dependent oxidoreductase [Candidatus Neomarinimicrobiota bacterium]MBT3762390.1 SDR family NAD(P)-dependent oxidoreductase [Candidatus Neomarinimicrobiota bacterium]MBT4069464.1 SDR family NAD(P)-dependent oxidoreductase [Candidatus Neomarinimicrobiota bacterium]MBT4270494.1 SDR family NAD(P)-dependent oxidoreductase [Candidatus Neomarinimicrobiota bacterium]
MNKKVFITGASSGIGEYLAYAYAKQNYFIGLAARRGDLLESVVSKCKELGGDGKAYPLDVLDADACKSAIDDFISLPGEVDTIYANAGVGSPDALSSGSAKTMNHILSINILGVTNSVMPFIPHLKLQKSGKIVVVSSVASFRGVGHHSAYSGSKAAVRNISQGWRSALYKYGISVTAICPGFIKSEMTNDNEMPMPFLLETNEAVKKIIRAVEKKKKVFIFPWQMRFFMVPLMRHAPDWIMRKLGI